jgi:hypothetical protein
MVATSDLVIEGTVLSIEPGRVVGSRETAIQFAQVTLSVDRLLFGNIDSVGVVIEEYGLESSRSSQVGDHGVHFLHQKTDARPFYRLVNSQGRFLDDGKGGLVALDHKASWVKVIEHKSLSEFESEVQAAARAVAEGRVERAKPTLGQG